MFFSLKQGNFLLINRYLCYATRNFDLNSDYPLIPAQPTDLFIQLIIIPFLSSEFLELVTYFPSLLIIMHLNKDFRLALLLFIWSTSLSCYFIHFLLFYKAFFRFHIR